MSEQVQVGLEAFADRSGLAAGHSRGDVGLFLVLLEFQVGACHDSPCC